MLLTSFDGASVDLRVGGYQFPDRKAEYRRDWDANWLNICGRVTQTDGASCTFVDPSLTTWEAEALGVWLRGAAAGTVDASPYGTGEPEQLLVFTEPNLAFSVEARADDRIWVRAHFSIEALPPWLRLQQEPDHFDYFVTVGLSVEDLANAADSWARDLAEYPER
jgi:hypothetical protein